MKYGIVVDSGCDLTSLNPEVAHKIDFTRAALKLDVGDKEFIDDFNLNIEEFMKEMYAYKGKTGSAAPSPGDFLHAFEKSEYVFAITITGALSGTYASAQSAAEMFKEQYPDRKIHLIDSKSAGPEITLIVKKLTEYMTQDMSFEEIVQSIENYRKHTHLLFVLKSLDNLVKNGRISKLQGSMAGILGIKILGTATDEGTLDLLQKCRGKMTAYDKAIEEMFSRGYSGGKVIIAHSFASDVAEYMASKIKSQFSNCDIEIMRTSGLCSYYAEQGGILISFEI
nr:DegV family protein [uncultured Cellulosilyticum sp.]